MRCEQPLPGAPTNVAISNEALRKAGKHAVLPTTQGKAANSCAFQRGMLPCY